MDLKNKNKFLYLSIIIIVIGLIGFKNYVIKKGYKNNILIKSNNRILQEKLILKEDSNVEYHEAEENKQKTDFNNIDEAIEESNKPIEHDNEEHEVYEALVIYFIIVCLVIGAIAKEIKKITNIPFTPILMIVGIILGIYSKNLGILGKGIDLIMKINPHGILFIFIPTLIFESAFNSDPFVFKREILQVITLAGPGVVIGSFLLATFFKIFLGYGEEFNWAACLTFSSIVCATDPVAVVALLKELGASTRFSILLEGESLLNDGTAMVFYLTFSSIYKQQSSSVISIILNFLQFSIGGPIFGIIVCFIIILWIRRIVKDDMLTMNLTFIACYFTFFAGEFFLEVSGILAIVALGITMGNLGKLEINPESEHTVHHVWSFLQFTMEIIIFILTGCFLGQCLFIQENSTISLTDWVRVFIFFILMTLARYIMLKLLKPVINKLGYPIDNKDVLVLTYGGLRGAIALCLALIVTVDDEYSKRFRDIVLFYVSMMILLTVLINGMTIKLLMKKINFQPLSSTKKKIQITLKKTIIIGGLEKQQSIIHDNFLKLVNWEEVYDISGMNNQFKEIDNLEADETISEVNKETDFIKKEKIEEARMRFYKLVKSKVYEIFEQSLCDTLTIRELNDVSDYCLEELNKEIWIWECISNKFLSIENLQYLINKKDIFILGYFVKTMLLNNILFSYSILSTIIKAMKEVLESHSKMPLPEEYVKIAFGEIKTNIKNCENYIFTLTDLFPDLVSKIQTVQATKIILTSQKHMIDDYLKEGYINNDEHQNIRDNLNKQIKHLTLQINDWNIEEFNPFSFISHVFGNISNDNLKIIRENAQTFNFNEGETILKKDGIFGGIYIIINGIVQEKYKDNDLANNYGMGSIFCLGNIVLNSEKSICEVIAVNKVRTYFISANVIRDLIYKENNFKNNIYKQAFYSIIKHKGFEEIFKTIPNLHYMIEKSKLISLNKADFIGIEHGGFLFEGKLKNETNKTEIGSYMFINWDQQYDLIALEDSYLLKFDEAIITYEDEKRNSISFANQRTSIFNVIQKEKDTDKLFNIIKDKIKKSYN